jgi:uncharacterized protein with HEPN domain
VLSPIWFLSMPRRSLIFRLEDILEAIEQIEQDIEGSTLESFLSDTKTRNSVVLELVIIGEAVSDYKQELSLASPDVPWYRLTGLRNQLVYGYFTTDDAIVWQIASEQIAGLKVVVQHMIQKLKNE